MANAIINYISKLATRIERGTVLEDIRITKDEIDKIVIPSLLQAGNAFSMDGFKSKEASQIASSYASIVKSRFGGRQPNFMLDLAQKFTMLSSNITVIEKLANAHITADIYPEGASTKKIVLIRIAENISFASRRSLDILNYIYSEEAAAVDRRVSKDIELSKKEIQVVQQSYSTVFKIADAYAMDSNSFEKQLAKGKDIIITGTDTSTASLYSNSDFDALTPASLTAGFTGNPIYHARMIVAEWQVSRYESSKEKKRQLELRNVFLESLKNGEYSPKIEKELIYNQNRISKIDKYLQEVEEDLGI